MTFRILHTSDWHLGQHFFGKTRADEHAMFFNWLLEQVQVHEVDALIVAGDIFDTGAPPSYARELYNRFVVELQRTDCQLVLLAGNHDSVATLNESKDLLACLNVHVVAGMPETPENNVLLLNDRNEEPGAILCAVPFLRQRDLTTSKAGQDGVEKQQALQQAIADYYARLFQLAQARREEFGEALPIIATGHLTTVGAELSESVRDIYIGALDAFPSGAFPPVDYLALGHIHRSQKVGGQEHIRYSGSPIPLSFDEAEQTKSVLMADFEDGRLQQVTPLETPCFQPMQVIRGDLKSIEKQLGSIVAPNSQLSLFSNADKVWVDIEVAATQDYLDDLQRRIQDMVGALPVEVLLVRRERKNKGLRLERLEKETLAELTVEEVFERRLAQEVWEGEDAEARRQRLMGMFRLVESDVLADGVEAEVVAEASVAASVTGDDA
ncbi:exonuclease subunit SbcD [Hahella sp. NBU794]|uniref:exonuclease subunit SbcD n=1 Tax=Hahella sp. NBU794 TaxID=3422590 RepID=UPI003D70146B